MPLILAFDTATKHCAVVLSEGGVPLASRVEEAERHSHAERLNVFIAEVMQEAGKELKELSAIAAGTGPGSYTGLRIGLSAAKGLCFGLDAPLIGMSTLEILVHEVLGANTPLTPVDALHPMIDARRMEVFSATFDAQGARTSGAQPLLLTDEQCAQLPTTHRHVVFGDGADKATELWARHPHIVHVTGVRPSVIGLAACAQAHFQRGAFADLAYLVPDYGKEANVGKPMATRPQ